MNTPIIINLLISHGIEMGLNTYDIIQKLATNEIPIQNISMDVKDGTYVFTSSTLRFAIDNKTIFKYTPGKNTDNTLTLSGGTKDLIVLDPTFNAPKYNFKKRYTYHKNKSLTKTDPFFYTFIEWSDLNNKTNLPVAIGNSESRVDYLQNASSYMTSDTETSKKIRIGHSVEYNTNVNPSVLRPIRLAAFGQYIMALDNETVDDVDDSKIKDTYPTNDTLDKLIQDNNNESDFEVTSMMYTYTRNAGTSGLTKGYRIPYSLNQGDVKIINITDTIYFIYANAGLVSYESAEDIFSSYIDIQTLLINVVDTLISDISDLTNRVSDLEIKVGDLSNALDVVTFQNQLTLKSLTPLIKTYNIIAKAFTCGNAKGISLF